MLRVAIVGCGKIADSHAAHIVRMPGCEIVGVFDREELMARQLADRFPVKACFSDFTRLLQEAKPDVVHITTPPQSHFEIGKQCLQAGCSIYVEKPFTLDLHEAEQLVSMANAHHRKLTVGHDEQFNPAARRMRELVENGYLGGSPVHMESTWCYNLGSQSYARALLGDQQHWVRRLPGKLLHNLISHGVAKIAEFWPTDNPEVHATGFTSPVLAGLGENEIIDELRVIITDGKSATAYFTFSSQMQPALHQFCLYGARNGLCVDEDRQTLLKLNGKRYKSYLEKFLPPVVLAGQCLKNSLHNVGLFLGRDFHMDSGKKHLIGSFYHSILEEAPLPIPYRQILLTARIMDEIFAQIAIHQGRRKRFEISGGR